MTNLVKQCNGEIEPFIFILISSFLYYMQVTQMELEDFFKAACGEVHIWLWLGRLFILYTMLCFSILSHIYFLVDSTCEAYWRLSSPNLHCFC